MHGGSSGIGITAIQLAREFRSPAYATAGIREKCNACLKLGANAAINYREEDFVKRIMELTGGVGSTSYSTLSEHPTRSSNLNCLCLTNKGRLVQIGVMHGSKVEDFDLLTVMIRRLTVTGSTMRSRTIEEKGMITKALREKVWPVLDAGRCGPVIYQVWPLAKVVAAHQMMESSIHIGKILLKVAD